MIAKIKALKISLVCFLTIGLISLLLSVPTANAEDADFSDQNGIKINLSDGITPEDILSSIEEGGLTSDQDLDEIKQPKNNQLTQAVPMPGQNDPEPQQVHVNIDTNSLKYFEAQGGLSSKPQNDSDKDTLFKSVTKFLERVVFRGSVEFTKTPDFDEGMNISGIPTFDKDTAGYAVIREGSQSVDIEFEQEYESPPIVTATISLQQYDDPELSSAVEDLLLVSDVKFIVTKISQKGFEIMTDHVADSDIPFSWHALSVSNPETF